MTWIVGTATQFGIAVAVADVQVTFGDGRTFDCLQKVYPLAKIGVGFAGDVELGFAIVDRLAGFSDLSSVAESSEVADRISTAARDSSFDFPASRRDSELMLVGVGSQRPFAITLRAPTFSISKSPLGHIVSIGSGSGSRPYAEALQRLASSGFLAGNLAKMPGGVQAGIARHMALALEKHPMTGISRAVQACTATDGGAIVQNVEYRSLNNPGVGDLIVPPVARRWEELQQMFAVGVNTTARAAAMNCV